MGEAKRKEASRKVGAGRKADTPLKGYVLGEGQAFNPIRKCGRNEPCPCGSGKKFKKCHEPIEPSVTTAEKAVEAQLFMKMREQSGVSVSEAVAKRDQNI